MSDARDPEVAPPPDRWTSGENYEAYVGRWSKHVAARFIEWLDIPPDRDWVDVGCGTGAVTRTVVATRDPRRVVSVDRSEAFLQFARESTNDPRVSFQVADAQDLPLDTDAFDVAISGLVLNFVPDHERMVREMARVVRPGGTVALYVWDYTGQMQMMRYFWDVALTFGSSSGFDEGQRYPIANHAALSELFGRVGLREIETVTIDIPTVFADFDDYWRPFLGGQGPAPTYVQSLDEDRRVELREALRRHLPTQLDGTIALIARALAIKAIVP